MSDVDYDSAIAVIGMAGRFPGAASIDELWDNLMAGRLGLRELSDEELLAAGESPARLADPSYVRTCGPIDGYDMFDAGMFGFTRREAEVMDPQHRLFLECCFAALEDAGYPAMRMPGRVGLFAGCGFPEYLWNVLSAALEPGGNLMLAIGTERDSFTSLVSYKLNLRGPSVTVQTFCSTSLVSVHLAVQALLNFECEYAIAGGAYILQPHGTGYMYEEGSIYSPDGKVRAFDAGARGSVVGSGVSVVVLRRLSDALADGDHINAVILGSAVNNDGSACAGYTAPGVDGQASVIADAIGFAGVKPETIDYVECHGTGTVLGDSIELAAMARVFPGREHRPVVLSSLKASIGHLDRAAGTSSLIRAVLALNHRVLPGTPNFETPNPALAAARKKFVVLTDSQPWPDGPTPRRAGVSAFGLGGTNAHVVLEEPPARPAPVDRPGPHLLTLSGRDAAAVDQATANLLRHLDRHPDLVIADVAYTLQQSRSYFPVRWAAVCDSLADARRALADSDRWITGEAHQRVSHVALVLPDPAAVDDEWCAAVRSAACRVTGAEPATTGSALYDTVLSLAEALGRLGVRVGRLTGPEAAAEFTAKLATDLGIAADTDCQAELSVGPDPTGTPAAHWFTRVVAKLWCSGAEIDWRPLHVGGGRRVPLPTYPFQRRRLWVDRPKGFILEQQTVGGRVDDLDKWTYLPTWRMRPLPVEDHSAAARDAGPWLVLAADERGEGVVDHLRGLGAEVVVARIGEEFRDLGGGTFLVRPDCADDMTNLLATLEVVPRTAVHAFCLATGATSMSDGGQAFADARAYGYDSVLALTAAYVRQAPELEVNLLAVTEGAVGVAGQAPTRAEHAALASLLPVLAQENPGWFGRHVDVDRPATPRAAAALSAAVVAEALAAYEGPVCLRGTSRWVRAFAPLTLPAPAGGGALLAEGRVVFITGGLGYVGLVLARHLAVHRRCRVVLASRTPLPPREQWEAYAADARSRVAQQVATLLELERLGAEILPVAADMTSAEQVRAAVELVDQRFGGIDLVVHAAGISDSSAFGPAYLVSAAGSKSHFDSKVTGFLTLREVLADRDVPGITLSSLSAVLGGLALGPYSAANAALDAYVVAARAVDGLRWVTVDWDTWGRDDAATPGEFDMSPAQAVEIFERAVAAIDHVDHIVISTGSLDARFRQWIVNRGFGAALSDTDDGERDPRPDLPTPYVPPREGTETELAETWSRVLRLDKVGIDDDFFRLGGNSVLAIEVVARIRKVLKVPVPTSAVMGFPTVRRLAAQIDELKATTA
jgi:acyl transferase domain-containing protein/acyl carrier protein